MSGYTWGRYRLAAGRVDDASERIAELGGGTARKVYDVKQVITEQSFNELLRDVYTRYPEYAENSVFAT